LILNKKLGADLGISSLSDGDKKSDDREDGRRQKGKKGKEVKMKR
jgi:hypothetical protein